MPVGRSVPGDPTRTATTLAFSDDLLLDAVTALAAAGSCFDVASAACSVLIHLDGVRGAAVLRRRDDAALVLSSAGYPCDTMSAGAELPLDSGLPAARAIKTGQLIRQGNGPGWCAVPFGRRATRRGALLLSLTGAPPADGADLARLQRLAAALAGALERAEESDRTVDERTALLAGLAAAGPADESVAAIRQTARGGALGGDVALCLDDARGRWLLVADVSGAGLAAASRAAAVRMAARALAPTATGPAHLLQLLDRALRPETPEGGFVTAVVVQVAHHALRVASAGHHAPVLLANGETLPLLVEPGPPLALETTEVLPRPVELITARPAGGLLVLYSDGLVDRRSADGSELEITALLAATTGPSTTAELADALLAAADRAGPADDDTSVLISRI